MSSRFAEENAAKVLGAASSRPSEENAAKILGAVIVLLTGRMQQSIEELGR